MGRFLQSKYRYPVFFVGALLMTISGFLYKYGIIEESIAVYAVVLGFAFFVLSIAVP